MPGPEGPAHTTPGSEAEHRSRLRAFTFCTKQSQDCHALQGAVQTDPRPQISLGHYAVTHDAAWLRWIAEKSSPIPLPSADSHIQCQRILKSRIPPGSVGRRIDRTREPRRSGCSISVEGAGPRFAPAKLLARRGSSVGRIEMAQD